MLIFFAAVPQLNDDDKTYMLDLYKNYYSLARKTIFSITHDTKDIEDLINDSFIKLINKISLLKTLDCCRLTAYVVYTVRSVAINHIKRKKVENRHMYFVEEPDITEDPFSFENSCVKRLIRQEELESLHNAICNLPQKQKDLLYFKYILELSDQEIAEIFGIAPNSVRQYLTRARRNAKKFMQKEMGNIAD